MTHHNKINFLIPHIGYHCIRGVSRGRKNTLLIGVGYEYWHNKFGNRNFGNRNFGNRNFGSGAQKAGIQTNTPAFQMEYHF